MKKTICLLIAAVMMFPLSGCVLTKNSNIYKFAESRAYTAARAGEAKDATEIDIDWVAGSVKIVKTDKAEVSFEQSGGESEQDYLAYRQKGEKLSIKFLKSGMKIRNLDKDLTVYIPQTVEKIKINTVSADTDAVAVKETGINSVSGKVNVSGVSEKLEINTVSGEISINSDGAEKIEVQSISGDADFTGKAKSGSFKTVSGDVTVYTSAGFIAKVKTVSGNVYTKKECTVTGKEYIFGSAENKFEFNTVSGNIELN